MFLCHPARAAYSLRERNWPLTATISESFVWQSYLYTVCSRKAASVAACRFSGRLNGSFEAL